MFNSRVTVAKSARLESKFLNHRRKSRAQTALSQIANCRKKKFTNPSSRSRLTEFSKRFASLWG